MEAAASPSAADYECALCLRLLYAPCTLRCGHSFCLRCCSALYDARQSKCPTCRRVLPLHGSAADMASSLTLSRLLEATFPAEYEARRKEDAAEAGDEATEPAGGGEGAAGEFGEAVLPIFYLDPMLPRQRLQLNIFEPRYRLMVRRCLEGSRRFGMVGVGWQSPLRHMGGGGGMRYGVEVEIVESEPQPDGRYHIEVLARGRRFEIDGATWEQDGYAMANVRWARPLADRQAPRASAAPAAPTPTTPLTGPYDSDGRVDEDRDRSDGGTLGRPLREDGTDEESEADVARRTKTGGKGARGNGRYR